MYKHLHFLGVLCLLIFKIDSIAQQSLLINNQKVNWNTSTFANITTNTTQSSSGVANWHSLSSLIDVDTSNFATLILNRNTSLGGSNNITTLELENNNTYLANTYVGFKTSTPNNFNEVLVSFYNGTSWVLGNAQSVSALSSGLYEIGAKSPSSFTKIRISFKLNNSIIGTPNETITIYNIAMVKYGNVPNTVCNESSPLVNPYFNLSVSPAAAATVIDPNTTDAYSYVNVIGLGTPVMVTDADIVYQPGSFLGFKVSNSSILLGLSSLDLLSNIEIRTYLGNQQQEVVSGSNVLIGLGLLTGNTPYEIGTHLTLPANKVELSFSSLVGSLNVHYPVFRCYTEGPSIACNALTTLTSPIYPLAINKNVSGLLNVGLLGENIEGLDNLIDNNPNNYTQINQSVTNIGNGLSVAVKKSLAPFEGGMFAGFEIGQTGLLSLDLINNLKIQTYLNGNLQESFSLSNAAISVNSSIINGSAKGVYGFNTDSTKNFNEIRLVSNATIGLNLLKDLRIYGVVVQKFCAGANLQCNATTTMLLPQHSIYIDGINTGYKGVASVLGSINNAQAVIDSSSTNFAAVDLTIGIGTATTFAVRDAIHTYNAAAGEKTYVAFDIAANDIANVDVLSAIKVKLILPDGTLSAAYPTKLLAGVNVLAGEKIQKIGIVADVPFVGAQLLVEDLVGVNLLGTLKIFGISFQKLCSVPLTCNISAILTQGNYPVILNNERTGAAGLVGITLLNSSIENAQHVLDNYDTTYAKISTAIGVASAASLSVLNPIDSFPIGSFAGFTIVDENSILQLDLFSRLQIKTYNNGVLQETKSANNLLNLELLGINAIGMGSNHYNVGFYTNKPFDEIQIVALDLIGANVNLSNSIRVYNAFVDTRSAVGNGLLCMNTFSDFVVTLKDSLVKGNVATNDLVKGTAIYSFASVNGTNPSNDLPIVNNDGSFTFASATKGTYQFNINICLPNQLNNCKTEVLTCYVIDPTILTNQPIVNDDAVFMVGNSSGAPNPIAIPIQFNDGVGNQNGYFTNNNLTIIDSPINGSIYVDSNNSIVYQAPQAYFGNDFITYQMCETPNLIANCKTAQIKITIVAPDAPKIPAAVDDYITVYKGTSISVPDSNGVLINDIDNYSTKTVVAQNLSLQDTGHFILNSDGGYQFSLDNNFAGPVQLKYKVINTAGTIADTANATLHVLVKSKLLPDLTVGQIFSQGILSTSESLKYIVSIQNIGNFSTTEEFEIWVTKPVAASGLIVTASNETLFNVLLNNYTLSNNDFLIVEEPTRFKITSKPGIVLSKNQLMYIGFNITRIGGTDGSINITTTVKSGTGGGEMPTNNNSITNQITKFN